ncbi:hypothetical protein [Burkholderia ubonensis]|uniref:hypothetical protein n=1 Tax=Burkholderia ubonensis TaxID=101571 RepID=UPI0011611B69|nr:hypothetical protein [Burkholderia ubonensis]
MHTKNPDGEPQDVEVGISDSGCVSLAMGPRSRDGEVLDMPDYVTLTEQSARSLYFILRARFGDE